MATFTQSQGTRTQILDLGTLASATFIASDAVDLGASIPLDATFEVECDPSAAPSGNKQLRLYVQLSLDNVNYGSGPVSGTDKTNILDLHHIGTLPCNDANVHRKFFNYSGLPVARYFKAVVLNDLGVALTSGKVYMAAITGASA